MSESFLWQPLSPSFAETRDQLHQIAYFALSPARYRAEGRMGLRPTPGGFGTPQFESRVARVDGGLLVHEQDGNVATQPISTVRAAAGFFGEPYQESWFETFRDPLRPIDPDSALAIDEGDSRHIGAWFDFAFDVLTAFGERSQPGDDASPPQIWPEHFDAAIERGDGDSGERASYGFSPGDQDHPDPYIYVAAWGDIDLANPFWNDSAFNGSSMGYEALRLSSDPTRDALDFFDTGYRLIHGAD